MLLARSLWLLVRQLRFSKNLAPVVAKTRGEDQRTVSMEEHASNGRGKNKARDGKQVAPRRTTRHRSGGASSPVGVTDSGLVVVADLRRPRGRARRGHRRACWAPCTAKCEGAHAAAESPWLSESTARSLLCEEPAGPVNDRQKPSEPRTLRTLGFGINA